MTEKQQKLYDLLLHQATLEDLSCEFNLSFKQMYQRIITLKNKGYSIFRKDFATGDVQFGLSNDIDTSSISRIKVLYTLPNTKNLRAIVMSDVHLDNTLQRLDVLDAAYDYCIKNNIHVIFNCGDFFNGLCLSSLGKPMTKDYEKQMNKSLKNYPFDPKIINYLVLGNHDNDYLKNGHINIKQSLMNKRYDLYPINYNDAMVKIKNDSITLVHPYDKVNENIRKNGHYISRVVFKGHSHINKIEHAAGKILVKVPTCSDMFYDRNYGLPSILDVNFEFNDKGFIKFINIDTLVYTDRFIKVWEEIKHIAKSNEVDEILYEENPKVLKKTKTLNQN